MLFINKTKLPELSYMSAVIIDGKKIAADIRAGVAEKVKKLKENGVEPCLAVILVGENPASVSYVTGKRKALAEAGIAEIGRASCRERV